MSDDELRAICAPRRWEAELERIGCLIALVIALLAVAGFAWFMHDDEGAYSLVVGSVMTFVAALAASGFSFLSLAGIRRRPFRAELDRRYGRAPHDTYLKEERAAFPADRAPRYTLLWSEATVPYPGHRWVRVHLWTAPEPRAHVEIRTVGKRTRAPEIETAELVRADAELPAALRSELLAFLDARGPASPDRIETDLRYGVRWTVTVLDRATDRGHRGSRIFARMHSVGRDHPSVKLAEILLRAGATIGSASE